MATIPSGFEPPAPPHVIPPMRTIDVGQATLHEPSSPPRPQRAASAYFTGDMVHQYGALELLKAAAERQDVSSFAKAVSDAKKHNVSAVDISHAEDRFLATYKSPGHFMMSDLQVGPSHYATTPILSSGISTVTPRPRSGSPALRNSLEDQALVLLSRTRQQEAELRRLKNLTAASEPYGEANLLKQAVARVVDLENEVSTLADSNSALQREKQALQKQTHDVDVLRSSWRQDMVDRQHLSENEKKALVTELEMLIAKHQGQSDEMQMLVRRNEDMQFKMQGLTEQANQYIASHSSLQQSHERAVREAERLKIVELQSHELCSKNANMEKQLKVMSDVVLSLEKEKASLQGDQVHRSVTLQRLEAENQTLKEEVATRSRLEDQIKQDMHRVLKENADKIEVLSAQLRQAEEMSQRVPGLEHAHSMQKAETGNLIRRCGDLEAQIQDLCLKLRNSEDERSILIADHERKQAQLTCKAEIADSDKRVISSQLKDSEQQAKVLLEDIVARVKELERTDSEKSTLLKEALNRLQQTQLENRSLSLLNKDCLQRFTYLPHTNATSELEALMAKHAASYTHNR